MSFARVNYRFCRDALLSISTFINMITILSVELKMIVRLNRYLSMCGVASRRKADELIKKGRVKINGLVANQFGQEVDTKRDKIEVLGKVIIPQKKKYIILNKPRFYLTALGKDEGGKKTIEELINDIPERVYPVGRLDYDTEGLLILTNDGELANRILHPRYKLPKIYIALVKGTVKKKTLEQMIAGTCLEDGVAVPDSMRIIKYENENSVLEITFHEGRKHIVKRFLLNFGHPVLRLTRIAEGPIKLGSLPRGRWRYIKESELIALRKSIGMNK